MKFRIAAVLTAVLALSACGEPWQNPGRVLVEAPAGTPAPPVNMTPGLSGDTHTRARMNNGMTRVYERSGACTTPNTAYAMHHMSGDYECAAMYTPQAHDGSGQVIFRDWLGRAYQPDSYGRWVRSSEYDLERTAVDWEAEEKASDHR